MSWPKPEIIPLTRPDKPRRWFWICVFLTLFIITAAFLIASWGDNNYFASLSFWLIAILAPFIAGGVALSIRFYLYGLAQERFDIWQQEQGKIDNNWQDWAMSSAGIMLSYWITPNELTATKILVDRVSLPVQIDKVLPFDDDEFEYEHYFEDLFYSFVEPLSQLPDNTKIAITLYSSSESYSYFDDMIHTIYQRCKINKPYSITHHLSVGTQAEQIAEIIDNPQYEVQLIIANNLLSKGSAFLGALLLVDKPLLPKVDKSLIESNLLRPMVTTNIDEAVKQMAEIQPAIKDVSQLWCANLDKSNEIEIVKALAVHHISPDSINTLDSLAGQQTDLAYWSLLTLGNQLVKQSQQNILLATTSQGKYLFSVLTHDDLG
ncbi:hypothetical protein RHO14_12020 [Orbus wheelerorum]|uniref:hypothetical protein n=1 Tax=Orbus wheelerorum TaxID=3074111 RepID=UPI00370D50C8